MATTVEKCGIKREKGWLYFLDKRGDVSRAKMARGGGKTLSNNSLAAVVSPCFACATN